MASRNATASYHSALERMSIAYPHPEIDAAHPDITPDGISAPSETPAHIRTYKHTAVADAIIARMRRDMPEYLSSRSIRRNTDEVLDVYGTDPNDRVRTMRVLSDAAHMRVFHETIDALMPGSRTLERFDDPQHPERILERVSSSLDAWAAQGRPMNGPTYARR